MNNTKKDVIEFLDSKKDSWFTNEWAVFYKGQMVFLSRSARNVYKSETLAKKSAARHLYTSKEIIEELVMDGLIEIKQI